MKNYLIYISILTLVLSIVYYGIKESMELPYNTFFIIPAFFVITVVAHLLLMRSAQAMKSRSFATYFMGAMGFKMFAYMVFLAVMHLALGGIDIHFVMIFFSVYLVYTTFEMIFLLPLAKGKNGKK